VSFLPFDSFKMAHHHDSFYFHQDMDEFLIVPQLQQFLTSCNPSLKPGMGKDGKSVFGSIKKKLHRTKSTSSRTSQQPAAQFQQFASRGEDAFAPQPATPELAGQSCSCDALSEELTDHFPAKGNPPPYSESDISPKAKSQPQNAQANAPSSVAASSTTNVPRLSASQEKFAPLALFDTVFLIDDSGSMVGSSWREVKAVLQAIAPICTQYDEDGVDVYFLNEKSADPGSRAEGKARSGFRNIRTAEDIQGLFGSFVPMGLTPTPKRLRDILEPYIDHYKSRIQAGKAPDETGVMPLNLIVITDGAPQDPWEVKNVLVSIAKELDRLKAPLFQCGVQFFQVGNDRAAADHLRHLDDDLHGSVGVRDIVDTVTWDTPNHNFGTSRELTAEGVLKTVLGAVVRRLDQQTLPNASGR
jgi:uncharacterized protein YegL